MLETRAAEHEYLDDPGLDRTSARQSYRFMKIVNRYFGGIRSVRRFLAGHTRPDEPVRVLDLGSGACDIPLAVTKMLNKSGRRVEFTCLEVNPTALAIARQTIHQSGNPFVQIIDCDAFKFEPDVPYDFAVGSMFFHHLSDPRIIELVEHLQTFVTGGIFINDLERSWLHYLACRLAMVAVDPITRHDALLSIRRSFTKSDLYRLLSPIEGAKLIIKRRWFYRLTAEILLNDHPV